MQKKCKNTKNVKNTKKNKKTLKNSVIFFLENTQLYLLEFGLCMPYLLINLVNMRRIELKILWRLPRTFVKYWGALLLTNLYRADSHCPNGVPDELIDYLKNPIEYSIVKKVHLL